MAAHFTWRKSPRLFHWLAQPYKIDFLSDSISFKKFSPSLTLFQPPPPSCWSLNISGSMLPQGLCMCCPECFSCRCFQGSFLPSMSVFSFPTTLSPFPAFFAPPPSMHHHLISYGSYLLILFKRAPHPPSM